MNARSRFLARHDLWVMLRQKETLLWIFLMPLVFFYFIGTVSGGFGKPSSAKEQLVLAAGAEPGFLADALSERLQARDYVIVRAGESVEGGSDVRVELPDRFTARVLAGEECKVRLVLDDEGRSADYHEVRVARAVYSVLADVVAIAGRGGEPDAAGIAALEALPRTLKIEHSSAGKRRIVPAGFDQTIPGTMVMFTMIVLLTSGAVLLLIEREQGLLRRLASAPIARGEIVIGKWGARMGLALVQIAFAMLVGRLVFRVEWGPDLAMVSAVLFGWAALCASLALLLGSLARSTGQAIAIGVLASNVLAALGGCWWPIEITPPWMQSLALALPTGWTMDALHRLVTYQSGAASALPHLCVLLASALAAGWAAARAFRYQ